MPLSAVPKSEFIKAILELIGSIFGLLAELGGLVMFARSVWHHDWPQAICWALFLIYCSEKAPRNERP